MNLINYMILAIALILILGGIAYAICKFLKLPKFRQIETVKEWLVYGCLQAEKLFGSKTGLIKLRYVYDLFVTKFPWIAQVISFEYFSSLVDEALEHMKDAIETNDAVKNIVGGD